MAGDYTRFTHKPNKLYSGVLMQQGRVQTDADWNEQIAIEKRRWEVQTLDTFCSCAVPETTADGFKVTEVVTQPKLDFNLGTGRIYVLGVLAEIFEEDMSYQNQPFYPEPEQSLPGMRSLVYIDVWDREITWVQDRDLPEVALLGPDTTTRIQTVWQVKVTEGSCETDLKAKFPPSAGRLSSQAVTSPSSDDPCIVSSVGGYRGLENRLYRVEIHDVGQHGDFSSVRFKWSRDNASIVSPVNDGKNISSGCELTVTRIGRDQILRFQVGNWIELLDDHRELMEKPGEIAQILEIDEANRKITLDQPLPTWFNAADPERHTRLIRWDQTAENSGFQDGLVAGKNGWIDIEDGVQILLSINPTIGDWFHFGDYWVFAARTVDGSVEELREAPPRGIIHHYCALATISDVGADAVEQRIKDCRCIWHCEQHEGPLPPPRPKPRCCLVVQPGESIQEKLDLLSPEGGCVCLKAGTHKITNPILIKGSNITLQGGSLGSKIVCTNGIRALSIEDPTGETTLTGVTVKGIRFEVTGMHDAGKDEEIVYINKCKDVRVADCRISVVVGVPPVNIVGATGFGIVESTSIEIHGNKLLQIGVGVLGKKSSEIRVHGNYFHRGELGTGSFGIRCMDKPSEHWHVEGNHIENFRTGIRVDMDAQRSTLVANTVAFLEGVVGDQGPELFGIYCAAAGCVIGDNSIEFATAKSFYFYGILVRANHARIENNTVVSKSPYIKNRKRFGISLEGSDYSMIQGNTLLGGQDAIEIHGFSDRKVEGVCVLNNQIGPLDKFKPGHCIRLRHTSGTKLVTNRISESTILGIDVTETVNLHIGSNMLEKLNGMALRATMLDGNTSITDNTFAGNTKPLSPLVEVSGKTTRILYSHNVCDHTVNVDVDEPGNFATIIFNGPDMPGIQGMIVVGNRVNGPGKNLPSINFNDAERVSLMANVVTGGFINLGSSVPNVYVDFNVIG